MQIIRRTRFRPAAHMMLKTLKKLNLRFRRYRRGPLRHPFAVPVMTTIFLIVLSSLVFLLARQTHKLPPVHDAKIVIISHDHQQQIVPSKESTVGVLLKKLHITLSEGDVVEPAANTPIDQDQFRINVYRAVPVQVVDGANKSFSFSAAKTPRAIAQQAAVQLFPEDIIKAVPAQNFLASGAIGEQIVVDRATPID